MKYEDEVRVILAHKLFARYKKRVRRLTKDCPQAEYEIIQVTLAISKLTDDVFNNHPACHAAVLMLAEAIKEMIEEVEKMNTGKVIYL